MSAASDVLLVNAALGLPGGIVLVGVDATASGITQSYAAIKRLAVQHARLQFEIVVKQVASEQVARTVFGNMAKLAQRDLAAELNYLGCIPQDEQQKRAAQMGKPVLEVYPTAASAQAYLSLTQKLLHLPPRPTEAKGEAHTAKGERRIAAQLSQRQYAEQPTLLIN